MCNKIGYVYRPDILTGVKHLSKGNPQLGRVAVFGCQASGKTFLSKKIGSILELPVCHLDEFIWGQRNSWISAEDNNRKIIGLLEKKNWIIEGTYRETIKNRILACDRAIFLNVGRWTCLLNMFQKRIGFMLHLKRVRPFERISLVLIRHIWENNGKINTFLTDAIEETGRAEKIVILKNRREINSFIHGLRRSPDW